MAGDLMWTTGWTTGWPGNWTITTNPFLEAERSEADDGIQAMKEAVMASKIDALEQRIKELEEKLK